MGGIVTPEEPRRAHARRARPVRRRSLIDLHALDDDDDLEALAASVRQCREMGRATRSPSEWGAREIYPGPEVRTDEELRDYVRRTAITYHHQVGTCRMGVDELRRGRSDAARARASRA